MKKFVPFQSLILTNMNIENRLRVIAKLPKGWYDGTRGVSFDIANMVWLSNLFLLDSPDVIEPTVVPSPDEELIHMEWNVEGTPSIEFNLIDKTAYFHMLEYYEIPEQSRTFNLTKESEINLLWEIIKANIPAKQS